MCAQPLDDASHVPGRSQVRAEPREPVVDDVRVRVIECGQDGRAAQRHDPRARAAELHHVRTACRLHAASRDCKVRERFQAAAAQGAHDAAREDQIRFHRADTVDAWG